MELDEVIKSRRSIRRYQSRDISDAQIMELLDLARYAPSSMDGQPWCFIIVREPEIKKKLAAIKNKFCPIEKMMYQADFLRYAPVIIVVCVDVERSYDREIENGVLATALILLGACNRGVGSVYMSAYSQTQPGISREIKELLHLPENIMPVNLVPIGYPQEGTDPKSVKPLSEIIYDETFRLKFERT
ncbi:nitroreductase family protein [candidate division CSSED10-310 bacterium]|uniref:Nitroreductase family protein n=1 Tax=candidate division CSSED10-310 bacterium TaxID=2855610 RepID=A0ABV6YYN0_UNCC1